MDETSIIFTLFLVFSGAAVIATLALQAGQALLVAYIVLGVLLGPAVFNVVSDPDLIADISSVGILFLLFLLGLNLEPAELHKLFREALLVTLASCVAFAVAGAAIAALFGFSAIDSLIIGCTMMFSSTIIALKLLPTSALHHQRMGELIVSVLLLQDMLAIVMLLLLQAAGQGEGLVVETVVLVVGLPLLTLGAWLAAKHLLSRLVARFDQIQEYVFLLAIGWCLGISELAVIIGLSHEIGAFIAGVTLATSPIARFIAESLKPLRDFFLVLFFFALGSGMQLDGIGSIAVPALLLAAVALVFKPWVFRKLLEREHEKARMAAETGARLGHISEFSLLVVVVALEQTVLSERAGLLVQTATVLSFVAGSWWIVRRYPTPISTDPALRRD